MGHGEDATKWECTTAVQSAVEGREAQGTLGYMHDAFAWAVGFKPARRFEGQMEGSEFKSGPRGQGYYKVGDAAAAAPADAEEEEEGGPRGVVINRPEVMRRTITVRGPRMRVCTSMNMNMNMNMKMNRRARRA